MIYFDHGATSPLDPKVLEAMMPYLTDYYANPSSLHSLGRKSKEAVETARMDLGLLFGKKMRSVYFTGSGTESDNLALATGVKYGLDQEKSHIISSTIEHPAVLRCLEKWEKTGLNISYIRPDDNGRIRIEDIEEAIKPETFLISLMTVNNEIGTIQPVKEIQAMARRRSILFHTDAIQAMGLFPTDFFHEFDLVSLSAHKFNGPKGVGALIARDDISLQPLVFGGGQERGIRSGTENVAAIIGLVEALKKKQDRLEEDLEKIRQTKKYFIDRIDSLEGVRLSTKQDYVGDNFIHLHVEGIDSDVLLYQLDKRGIWASAGSACSAGATEKSHVLSSLGREFPQGSPLRITLDRENSKEDMDHLYESLEEIRKMR